MNVTFDWNNAPEMNNSQEEQVYISVHCSGEEALKIFEFLKNAYLNPVTNE